MPKGYKLDLAGKTFGRLKVLEKAGVRKELSVWKCLCECGNKKEITGAYLTNGSTRSCGCLMSENNKIHGQTGTVEFTAWVNMMDRCYNPNRDGFKYYGGRGIKVQTIWRGKRSGPLNFLRDMGKKPEGMSLDRIDVNKNYGPHNCRWATKAQQAKNRRSFKAIMSYTDKEIMTEYKRRGLN